MAINPENLIRFSLSTDENNNIEIYSCATRTKILLPQSDKELLIEALMSFHQT